MDYLKRLWQRLIDLPAHLSKRERASLLALAAIIIIFGGYKLSQYISNRLVTVPAPGGALIEGIAGHPKLLSVLSTSEITDQTVLSLIYDGLTYTTADGQTKPALAESWDITDDGKTYNFTLREGLTWHDGTPITTSDIAETVGRTLDSQTKSPYQEDWIGVTVEIVDPINIKFHLEEPAAGFLSSTNLPITPIHIPVNEIQNGLIGSGPYKYLDSEVENNQITRMTLVRNDSWYRDLPYVDQIIFRFFDTEEALVAAYQKNQVDSVVLSTENSLPGQHLDLVTQRLRAVFLNTEREALKDVAKRRNLINNEDATEPLSLRLITHSSLAGSKPLSEQVANWDSHNIKVEVVPLDSIKLLEAIDSHDYDLLYVDIDMRADLDRYPLWHSSQREAGQLNFARLDDAALDKLLEQAHITTDLEARRQITTQVDARLNELAPFKVLEQVRVHWYVSDKIIGVDAIESVTSPADRFFSVSSWYIKTKQRPLKAILQEQALPATEPTDSVDTVSS